MNMNSRALVFFVVSWVLAAPPAFAADITVEKSRRESPEDESRRLASGELFPEEMVGTEMFYRLRDALSPHFDAKVLDRDALQRDQLPAHRITGNGGAWQVVILAAKDKGFATQIGLVPGAALEAAGFGLSAEHRTIIDRKGRGIKGVDTLGLDSYVVDRAIKDAWNLAVQQRKSEKARSGASSAAERIKALFSGK